MLERYMTNATLDWIDAKTPHAKRLQNDKAAAPRSLRNDSEDIRSAVERVEKFQARVRREAVERPLVLAESA
jgi:hypothetical protein